MSFDSPRRSEFREAKPRGTLRLRGNKTHCFLRSQSLSVLLYLPTQKEKLLWLFLMVNISILSLIWSGTAYFVANYTNTFHLATPIEERVDKGGRPTFGAKPKAWRHKTFIFSRLLIYLICFCDYKTLFLNKLPSLTRNGLRQWLFDTSFPRFQGAQPDHVRVQSSSCCFPKELVSFVCPRELVSFDPRHVTHSPQIGKRIWVGRYNKASYNKLFNQSGCPILIFTTGNYTNVI